MLWFDAHLDLAYLAVNGRDMLAMPRPDMGPHAPAGLTLASMVSPGPGKVRVCLGTIFTEPGGDTSKWAEAYPPGDFARAFVVGRAQLEVYLTWQDQGLIRLDCFESLRQDPGMGQLRGGMGVAEVVPTPLPKRLAQSRLADPSSPSNDTLIHVGILMENADPIRSVADLAWWRDRGLVAVGLAWAKSSRYAGGNITTDGITAAGRELVREMDRLSIVHDTSHLSDRAFAELLDLTPRTLIASHSNCRALLGDASNQRHLTDEQIRHITARNGVIGLNLYTKFLDATKAAPTSGRATLDRTIAHVEHICSIAGNTRCVGLGTDMDGGFEANRMPEGIDTPADLDRLAEALRSRGWSDDQINSFAHGNFTRVLIDRA